MYKQSKKDNLMTFIKRLLALSIVLPCFSVMMSGLVQATTFVPYVKQSGFNFTPGLYSSVASDGNTVVIGNNNLNNSTGVAYVYVNNSGNWSLQAVLHPNGLTAGSDFGTNVMISGNNIAVSSPLHAIYLYQRNGYQWNLVATITPPTAQDAQFDNTWGWGGKGTVALMNNTLLVEGSSIIYQYTLSGNVWSMDIPAMSTFLYQGGWGSNPVKFALDSNGVLVVAGQNVSKPEVDAYVYVQEGNTFPTADLAQPYLVLNTYNTYHPFWYPTFQITVNANAIAYYQGDAQLSYVGVITRGSILGAQWGSVNVIQLPQFQPNVADAVFLANNLVFIDAETYNQYSNANTPVATYVYQRGTTLNSWVLDQKINNLEASAVTQSQLLIGGYSGPGNYMQDYSQAKVVAFPIVQATSKLSQAGN